MLDGTNAAIRAALCCHWDEAIKINKAILAENVRDLEALNRLARAYLEKNQKNLALKTVRAALKIDPYNQIALKLKTKCQTGKAAKNNRGENYATLSAFIEEPGKTKAITLINCAPPRKIGGTECAQKLLLIPKHHTIHVTDCEGNYLGMLPDDLGKRLNLLMKGGNIYQCFIKSVGEKDLTIFIREAVRAKKFKDIPSFPAKISMDHIIDHADEILAEEEKRGQKSKVAVEPEEDEDDLPAAKTIHQDEEPEE